jgi:hypothetical protein
MVTGRLIAVFISSIAVFAGAGPKARQPRAEAKVYTGCLDQREAGYVLTDDVEMKPFATLHGADGAATSDDNLLARFLGHRVRVEGRAEESREGGTVIRVRRITSLAETCETGQR